jgi:tRNA(Ile)-lysidine synthase
VHRLPGQLRALIVNKMRSSSGRIAASLLDPVRRVLSRARLSPADTILIALSGGPDSVALTHALHLLQQRPASSSPAYRLAAAHLNHRLRGEQSDRDERFVLDLCRRLGIELVVERAAGLSLDSPNLEEFARDHRYAFLNRTADRMGARHIATAHHADDQAETVLLRLLRGSGAAGLAAMAENGRGRLIRPLLAVRRQEILAWLAAIGAEYVTDATNFSPDILRNRVRHQLIPMLERQYIPGLGRRLSELSSELHALDDFLTAAALRELTARTRPGKRLDLQGFSALHPALAATLMREFVRSRLGDLRRFGRGHFDSMRRLCLDGGPSSMVASLPRGWRLRREYTSVVLEQEPSAPPTPYALPLATTDETMVSAVGVIFDARIIAAGEPGFPSYPWHPEDTMQAYFDAGEVCHLAVRGLLPGDRLKPLGMSGSRKLHDVFIDRKVPRVQRTNWPLVVVQDEIAWVPKLMRARVAIVTAATRSVLHLRVHTLKAEKNPSLLRN